ncbi:hypothetical protein B0H17DRAFT_1083039 [Mycena rosella]|uniref:MYND-type domain-containing protein n=1 Tax=Mycena rosella TaxID=1033263 RepID=A0AAD7D1C3_MYCRO|nr:hypothetical protein B0H17DRAFT_1083039 [Mycena rosella]
MAEPSERKRLNKAPPAEDFCALCFKESEEENIRMQKCSSCKNAFYCSTACQKKDWNKKHKFECSSLPIGELAYLEKMAEAEYKATDDEVRRVSLVLQQWMDAYEPHKSEKNWNPKLFGPNQLLKDIELSYPCSVYTRTLPDPFRTQMVRIIRLFLIHFLASPAFPREHNPTGTPSDDPLHNAKALEWSINGSSIPSSYTQLWAPKIVCRPGELSPPEYIALPFYLWNITMGMEEGEFEGEERAYRRRLLNLTIVYRALFMKAAF